MTLTEKRDLLRLAVLERRPVHAIYKGMARVFCPHVLGIKNGSLNVHAYQYGGETSAKEGFIAPPNPDDGPPSNWRCMKVELLEEIVVLPPGMWYTSKRATRPQTCVDRVLILVSEPATAGGATAVTTA